MVVWPFIFFRTRNPTQSLIRHEFEHCYQIKKVGIWKFYTRYIALWFRYGYKNHPDEVAAREVQYETLTEQEQEWYRKRKIEL